MIENNNNFKNWDAVNEMVEFDDVLSVEIEKYDHNLTYHEAESAVKRRYPILFETNFTALDAGCVINQGDTLDNFFSKKQYFDHKNIVENSKKVLESKNNTISFVYSEVSKLMSEFCDIEMRIKDQVTLERNLKQGLGRAKTDLVGIRISPHYAKGIITVLETFKNNQDFNIVFTINTFSFSPEYTNQIMGERSKYYKAIHFYIPIEDFFIEIQVRTPFINAWSILHHDLVYKNPNVDQELIDKMNELGEKACLLDYHNILTSN